MFLFIDRIKFIQLSIGIFGVFSVYIIHSIIYERLIMAPFKNSITQKEEFFSSESGFILVQKFFAWVLTQMFALIVLKDRSRVNVPHRYSFFCGLFVFLSSILFTTGIFELSFRLSFSNRTSTYLIVTLIGIVISPLISSSKTPEIGDIFSGLGIGLGVIIFWMFGQDLWIYTPTKNGYIYNWMVVTSGICDGILALIQSRICQKYKPTEVELLLKVSRWTVLCCFCYVLVVGDLHLTIQFCLFHHNWVMSMFGLAALYFVGQLFIYRITTKMAMNVPAFITTSRKVLTIHQSYMLSSLKITQEQMIGMIISWTSIFLQVILFTKKQTNQSKQFQKIPHHEVEIIQFPNEKLGRKRSFEEDKDKNKEKQKSKVETE